MKDEIKEILDGLEKISTPTGISYSGDVTINNDDVKILKDYITNLQEELEDLRRIFGIWNNRKLINKFNKEYDKEDKNKNPNRNYVAIYPDSEEVYKRYYDYKSRNEKAIEYIRNNAWYCYKDNEENLDRIGIEKILSILGNENE